MKSWILFLIPTMLYAPPKFLSESADSGLVRYFTDEDEVKYLKSQLFTYRTIADIREKQLKKLQTKKKVKKRIRKKKCGQ